MKLTLKHRLLIVAVVTLLVVEYVYPLEALTERPAGDKVIVITFDDGTAGQYTTAYPILEKYGIKASFGVITGDVGKPDYLTWPMIEEMRLGGQDIVSHTVDHLDLSTVYNPFLMAYELEASKLDLRAHGIKTDVLILPFGAGFFNPIFRAEIGDVYNYSLTIYSIGSPYLESYTLNGYFNRLNIPRVGVYNLTDFEAFRALVDNFTLKNETVILVYHKIGPELNAVNAARFDEEMKYLKDNGVTTETLTEYLEGAGR